MKTNRWMLVLLHNTKSSATLTCWSPRNLINSRDDSNATNSHSPVRSTAPAGKIDPTSSPNTNRQSKKVLRKLNAQTGSSANPRFSISASYGTRRSYESSCGNFGRVGEAPESGNIHGTTRTRTETTNSWANLAGGDTIPTRNHQELHTEQPQSHRWEQSQQDTDRYSEARSEGVGQPLHGHAHLSHKVGLRREVTNGEIDGNCFRFFQQFICGLRTAHTEAQSLQTGSFNIYHRRHRLSACFVSLSPCTHLTCGSGTVCTLDRVDLSLLDSHLMLVWWYSCARHCANKSEQTDDWLICSSMTSTHTKKERYNNMVKEARTTHLFKILTSSQKHFFVRHIAREIYLYSV